MFHSMQSLVHFVAYVPNMFFSPSLPPSLSFSLAITLSLAVSLCLSDFLIVLSVSLSLALFCFCLSFFPVCLSPPNPPPLSHSFCLGRAGCKKILSLLHYPHKIKVIYSFLRSVSHICSLSHYCSLSLSLTLSLSFSICLSLTHAHKCVHARTHTCTHARTHARTHTLSLSVSFSSPVFRSSLCVSPPPPRPSPPISFCLTHSFSLCDFLSFSVCLSLMHTCVHTILDVLISKWKKCNACTICDYLVSDKTCCSAVP